MKANAFWLFLIAGALFVAGCQGEVSKKTPSGFDVIFHTQNDGPKPQANEWIYFIYSISVNDSLVDSWKEGMPRQRMKMPAEVSNTTDGFFALEAFQMMAKGDSVTLKVPASSLPPGLPPFIKPTDILVYTFKIDDIKDEAGYQADLTKEREQMEKDRAQFVQKEQEIKAIADKVVADFKAGANKSEVKTTASGLKYIIHEEGSGALPQQGQTVEAHYYGTLGDGQSFDNSYKRGEPISFSLGMGQMIKAWDEAFALFKQGTKATLVVPPSLGYGEQGSPPVIPPNTDLYFYVEFTGIK